MLKKILATIGTRYVIALLNLLLIFINGKVLGVDGMGLVGVIYASANIALICNSILCGSTIVYFMNRYDLRYVFWPAYVWSFIGSAIACFVMDLFHMLPGGFEFEVYGLSVILSFVAIHSRVLLGKDRMKAFNITFMLQAGLLFFVLLCLYFGVGKKDAEAYVWGLFITNGIAWGVSLILVVPYLLRKSPYAAPASPLRLIREMFVYGLWGGADNLAESLASRFNYFLLQRLGGYGQVGLLDAGTKISESIWHISRSVSFISYSQTAKINEPEVQRQLTLRFFKLTYCALTAVMIMVLLIPEWVYTDYLFTDEFKGIPHIVQGLSVGIIALGSNSVLGHYFIGTGKVKYSAFCSFTGLSVLLITGSFLIPAYHVYGAAVSTSIAFTAMLVFSVVVFVRMTKTALRELLPTNHDFKKIKDLCFTNTKLCVHRSKTKGGRRIK